MNYRIAQKRNTDLVLGVQLTGAVPDQVLRGFYGTTPISGQIYLRLSPSLMTMSSIMRGMNGCRSHRMDGHH